MSTSLLEKLKVKPVPKKIEQIKVKIVEPAQQENVEIQTIVLDKTKDRLINRGDFLQKLKKTVSSNIPGKVAPTPIAATATASVYCYCYC